MDQAVKAVQAPQEPSRPSLLSYKAGGATLRLIDVSFDLMAAGGTSTFRDKALQKMRPGAGDYLGMTDYNVQQLVAALKQG